VRWPRDFLCSWSKSSMPSPGQSLLRIAETRQAALARYLEVGAILVYNLEPVDDCMKLSRLQPDLVPVVSEKHSANLGAKQ
jgi:hypothetical protein